MGARREADEVNEEDGDDLAFFTLRSWSRLEWCGALGAELSLVRIVLSTVGTYRHKLLPRPRNPLIPAPSLAEIAALRGEDKDRPVCLTPP